MKRRSAAHKARTAERDRRFGYLDNTMNPQPFRWRVVPLLLAILFLVGAWLFLTQKILFGDAWLSETYDTIDWRTNEGNLQTYGAWDLEAHVWKSEFIMKNWPNVFYNPFWYLGMPLFKYYQAGFYAFHIALITAFNLSPARAANLLIIFGHLAATLCTFFLCLRISRRYALSAMLSFFLLANTFISLRSYGWEPITVVFLALYPLGLLVFLREPLRPFRFWMVLTLTVAYLMHPLIWFSLCMTMGLYLFTIAISANYRDTRLHRHKIFTQYLMLVIASLLLGGIQSVPQFTYTQVTSGAHMGVKYLPFYHVPNNVIAVKDFLFDYSNLKGPGPIVMLALFFLVAFILVEAFAYMRDSSRHSPHKLPVFLPRNVLLHGFALTMFVMILFYVFEAFNLFPMNLLRSIQYHRIIPEFVIASAALLASLASLLPSRASKIFYYGTILSFVVGGFLVIDAVQDHWQTVPDISQKPEFIYDSIPGRISMTYTEQSLSVRSSFREIPQAYGYYEQGITNSYADEIFSVSSGFHPTNLSVLYLRAADISRIYVNREAGERNRRMQLRLNGTLPFIDQNYRYAYYSVPIRDASFAQAVSSTEAAYVLGLEPGCREMFQEQYCGSVGEEFVLRDAAERAYLEAYVNMLENEYPAQAAFTMVDPDHYRIEVTNATMETAIVVKMTKADAFVARMGDQKLEITPIGPDFMLVRPAAQGDYTLTLTYELDKEYLIGGGLSIVTLIGLICYFGSRPRNRSYAFPRGDMVM